MKIPLLLSFLIALMTQAQGFFRPLTPSERVQHSEIIAVMLIQSTNEDFTASSATVVTNLKGTRKAAKIEIATDSDTSGRDPFLEEGKTYLIYLKRDERGKWVTPQSSSDAFEIKDDMIAKEREKGEEPLEERLKNLQALLAKLATEEKATNSKSENPEPGGR